MNDLRVLIVDDSKAFRQALRAWLAARPGNVLVGEAGNSDEALSQVAATNPDLVLVDLVMPGVDGLGTARLIKQRAPDTFVIILSVIGGRITQLAATAAGADGFAWKGNLEGELGPVLAAGGGP